MQQKLGAILALFTVLGLSMAALPAYQIFNVTDTFTPSLGGPAYTIDACGDILVSGVSAGISTYNVNVYRRNPDGTYKLIAEIADNYASATNGEWLAVFPFSSDVNNQLAMYKLENGNAVLKQTVTGTKVYNTIGFFSSDVFVAEYNNYAITTSYLDIYVYNNIDNEWQNLDSVEIGDHFVYGAQSGRITPDRKFVTTANETTINIYQFKTPYGFDLIDSFVIPSDDPSFSLDSALYNGVDTLVLTDSGYVANDALEVEGALKFFKKTNGNWSPLTMITAVDLELEAVANLGYLGTFIDADTLIMTAIGVGSTGAPGAPPGGAAVVFSNDNGLWSGNYMVNTSDPLVLGFNAVMNDYGEILIPGFDLNAQDFAGAVYSTCLPAPMNVSCMDTIVTLNDCNTIDLTALYTVYSSPACGTINVTLVSQSEPQNSQITLDLMFTKPTSTKSITCSVTVTCPAEPVAAPVAPVAAPVTAPTSKKSSAAIVELAFSVLLLVIAGSM